MNTEDIELRLFSEGIFLRYGYDFRSYTHASFRRRVENVLRKRNFATISQLQSEVLHSSQSFFEVLTDLTVTTSEMFRDPNFFTALRTHVVPLLRTYPSLKIWIAGCSSGEELYSLAILLMEEELYQRAVIYATDINRAALKMAKDGIYTIDRIKSFTSSYIQAGGKRAFSDYYTAAYGSVRMDRTLLENVVFAEHNLATDSSFSEMQLILCRNVLIYFNRDLQNRATELFTKSLSFKGYLCLGSKESLRFLRCAEFYEAVDEHARIYQKKSFSSITDVLGGEH